MSILSASFMEFCSSFCGLFKRSTIMSLSPHIIFERVRFVRKLSAYDSSGDGVGSESGGAACRTTDEEKVDEKTGEPTSFTEMKLLGLY